jgi:hypothetical protein
MGALVKGKPRLQTTKGEFANSIRPFLGQGSNGSLVFAPLLREARIEG